MSCRRLLLQLQSKQSDSPQQPSEGRMPRLPCVVAIASSMPIVQRVASHLLLLSVPSSAWCLLHDAAVARQWLVERRLAASALALLFHRPSQSAPRSAARRMDSSEATIAAAKQITALCCITERLHSTSPAHQSDNDRAGRIRLRSAQGS